jgi:hypothetical protein
MSQIVLPGLEPVFPDDALPPGAPATPSAEGQLELFADRVVLAREIENAVGTGRFEEAARLRAVMVDTYGRGPTTDSFAFVERLAAEFWTPPLADVLSRWLELEAELRSQLAFWRRVRRGVFTRLLAGHGADELVRARPECLGALASVLAGGDDVRLPCGPREGRRLVRDALLDGRPLDPTAFEGDEPLADVLAEDLPPRWMACLGAIRRLWPAPAAVATEIDAFVASPLSDPADADTGARAFWLCLRVAESPDCPEGALHEARRRMKRLHPELHGAYMHRAR